MHKKIVIITDAWTPQVNGVVTTLKNIISIASKEFDIHIIHPGLYKTIPFPTYPEIRLPIDIWNVSVDIKKLNPDHIHIATEGLLGLVSKLYCDINNLKYTTAYHTKFPEYIESRIKGTQNLVYKYLRWFHAKSKSILITTNSMKEELETNGFGNLVVWTRGVDRKLFKHIPRTNNTSPILIYVGRVSIEKNIEAYLNIDLPYQKLVVGDGPELELLKSKYPKVTFLGSLSGNALVKAYNLGDVFVFPSKTDTFGLVQIEANACGLPIAAYPVTGPKDIIVQGMNGFMSVDLKEAVVNCLGINKSTISEVSDKYTWDECTKIFLEALVKP